MKTPSYPGLPDPVEKEAQRIAAQLLATGAEPRFEKRKGGKPDWRMVDVNAVADTRPRRIGVSHVGLWALEQLGFEKLLQDLGVSGPLCRAAVGSVIGRMAEPGSEHASYAGLAQRSALAARGSNRFSADDGWERKQTHARGVMVQEAGFPA